MKVSIDVASFHDRNAVLIVVSVVGRIRAAHVVDADVASFQVVDAASLVDDSIHCHQSKMEIESLTCCCSSIAVGVLQAVVDRQSDDAVVVEVRIDSMDREC